MISEFVKNAREEILKIDTRRDKGLTTPGDILRFDDICYGKEKEWQVLDVYRPKADSAGDLKKLPVIVSVHGGGWIYGNKEIYQFYCMDLARRGFAVVNFTYRLAPEFKFPAQVQDVVTVFEWTHAHAAEYGFDTDRLFAAGDSAGGYLLANFCTLCGSREYANLVGVVPSCPAPKAVALNCGVYHIDFSGQNASVIAHMGELLEEKGSQKEQEQINFLPYVNDQFPKAYVMIANEDKIVEAAQADMICRRLDEVGAVYEMQVYGTREKPLDHVFHLDIRLEEGKICNDRECEFFRLGCE